MDLAPLLITVVVGVAVIWGVAAWCFPANGGRNLRVRWTWQTRAISALIVAMWAYGSFGNFITFMTRGRSAVTLDTVQPNVPAAQLLLRVLLPSILVYCVVLIVLSLRSNARTDKVGHLALALAPFAAILISDAFHPASFTIDVVTYPIVVLTVWLLRPQWLVVKTIGVLTVVTAVWAIVMGIVIPDVGTTLPPIVGDKAYWPTLLVGPYEHSNVLGLAIAFGVPFIFMFNSRLWIYCGLAVSGVALFWSANRCSVLAAGVAVAFYAIATRAPLLRSVWVSLAAIGGAVLVTITPLVTKSPDDFSARGLIWLASFPYISRSPLIGWGSDFYRLQGNYQTDFGLTAFNGHNAFVHLLTTGGALLLTVVVVLYVVSIHRGLRVGGRYGAIVLTMIVSIIWNSWLQNTIEYVDLGELAYASWVPVAILLFVSKAAVSASTRATEDLGVASDQVGPEHRGETVNGALLPQGVVFRLGR